MSRNTADIQQVDAVRLTWVDTNNRTETIFKPLDHDVLCVTPKPSSPVLIYKHKFILYDSRLIFHRQLTLPISAECSLVYWPCISRCIGRHIGRQLVKSQPIRSQEKGGYSTKIYMGKLSPKV